MIPSCFALLVILIALPILAGCEEKPPLSNETLAALLREDGTKRCDRQTVSIRPGRFGLGRARRAENWFDRTLLTDPRFVHLVQTTDDSGNHGELVYRDQDDFFRVTWSQFDQSANDENNRLSITGCIYLPKSIHFIDTAFASDRRSAQVKFQEQFGLSLLGKQMSDAGILKIYEPMTAPSGYEYLASLSRAADGNWRIKTVVIN